MAGQIKFNQYCIRIFLVFFACVLSGCELMIFVIGNHTHNRRTSFKKNESQVVFLYDKGLDFNFRKKCGFPRVEVDGNPLEELKSFEAFYLYLSPGKHQIDAHQTNIGKIEVDGDVGEITYIELYPVQNEICSVGAFVVPNHIGHQNVYTLSGVREFDLVAGVPNVSSNPKESGALK